MGRHVAAGGPSASVSAASAASGSVVRQKKARDRASSGRVSGTSRVSVSTRQHAAEKVTPSAESAIG